MIATLQGSSAAHDDDFYLDSPLNGLGLIFNNHTTPIGTTRDLGFFTAGTELIFKVHVENTGDDFFSGPGSRNLNGLEHAVEDDAFAPGQTLVGFEDLYGGGDRDYNDVQFTFTNVRGGQGSSVPEPATLALAGIGLGLAAPRRKAQRV